MPVSNSNKWSAQVAKPTSGLSRRKRGRKRAQLLDVTLAVAAAVVVDDDGIFDPTSSQT